MHDIMSDFDNVSPDLWIANEETWKERLLKLPNWHQIPLINTNASHNLVDGSLVRFRGMIQDMHNPEFYFDQFEVYNSVTNEVSNKSGKYRDTANIMDNEKINYAQNFQSAQRQTMVVVSLPGLSEWVQKLEHKQNHLKHLEDQPNTSKRLNSSSKLKRTFDEADDGDIEGMEVETEAKEPRKVDKSNESTSVVSREHLLNFPLPDVPSQSCIVKLYEDSDTLKLNDMVEVVGFLSVDAALSGEFQPERDSLLEPLIESEAETITHNPPPSLVPRLHAVHVKRLDHCNPLVQDNFDQDAALGEAEAARGPLLKALTELLLGDQLAAEYLICHLIACVYLRQEALSLGQCCLNISNVPLARPAFARQLYDVIRHFLTHSYYLPLTIHNMNTLTLLPKKDYECNRLTSGVLQLTKHTHLVLDETKLEEGRLDATGVNNVATLGRLITTQKVEYDFKFYKMEFDSDVSVLILSEGKSLLPSDYHVPLRPEPESVEIFDAIVEAATYYLKEDIMNLIRRYLTHLKLVKFTIGEDLKFVQDDFIEMRSKADASEPVTGDDLHRLLVLARLVGLARGRCALDRDAWDRARAMEDERLRRLRRDRKHL